MKNTCIAILLIIVTFLSACSQKEKKFTSEEIKIESEKLTKFLDRVFDASVDRDPKYQSYLGIKKDYDKWNNLSDEFAKKEIEILKSNLDSLKTQFNFNALDNQSMISYKLFEMQGKEKIEGFAFRFHNYPENQMDGLHSDIPSFMINIHQVSDFSDAEAYISRIRKTATLFDQHIESLKVREKMGIIPPKFVFPMVKDDCKNILAGQPFDNSSEQNPILEDFTTKVNALKDVSAKQKEKLISDLNTALKDSLKYGYDKMINYWTELESKASNDDGAWKFPEGTAFYNHSLKVITTTDLTAEQIHELGLKEVERIHNEMKIIMEKVNYKGSLREFFEFMRKDKQFYYPNSGDGKKEYLAKSVDLIENMKSRLDELFITKPKADIVVKAVEAFREKSAGGAFYEEPALDGSRPGRYYVNLFNMDDQATYQMEALAYHEGIPGHHMQISIAQELQNLPKFRKLGGNVAYVEGWALYSELIPKELGFYADPYSDFGRLAMELFRAVRLVVDTGIHLKKWTREQAITYMNENTPNPEGDNRKEIERYIVWPAQATGYKIGMLKIVELRNAAKNKLGDKFNIREFHDVVLTSGPVPLKIMEENVNDWISSKL